MYTLNNNQITDIYKVTLDEFNTFANIAIPNGALCDIGTGGGRYAFKARQIGFKPVYGIDIDSMRVFECERKNRDREISFLKGDIENISTIFPIIKQMYLFNSITMMTDTLNFMKNKKNALKNCYELLQAEGKLYISLSNPENSMELYKDIYEDEVLELLSRNGLSSSQLENLLLSLGFQIELDIRHTNNSMFLVRGSK